MQGEARLDFPVDHPAFAGHFPGHPIVPGVLLLDAVIHAVQQLMPAGAEGEARCKVISVKFLSPVSPGECLELSWSSTDKGQIRFDIGGPGRRVANGLLNFETAA